MNLLFLDLDGTVRETVNGDKFIGNDFKNQKIINGVVEALVKYHDYKIIGITNQMGVMAGYKSLENCISEQFYTMQLLPVIDRVYFCPDAIGEFCYCVKNNGGYQLFDRKDFADMPLFRKHCHGMISLALRHEAVKIDNILMVGDRQEDFDCAKNAGISFQWADSWRLLN